MLRSLASALGSPAFSPASTRIVSGAWATGAHRFFSQDVTVKPVEKLLIANRGEIACRVMKTAKKLGIRTVAVYSDADANSLHVSLADEAVHIGPSPAIESYLKIDKILEVAKQTGADAIHPGYGFLSENAIFADACKDAGIKFVGPPSSAIRAMGSKSESKSIMTDANVPVVPGYHGDNQDPAFLKEEARKIGYPVMIKAVLGGGGKGMRIVRSEDEFDEMLEGAKREAMSSFSDDVVLIEKYIDKPRHVELQVFADQHGDAVHLFERDCSVQRRHQKVVEEAPAPNISTPVRHALGEAAVNAAKAVGYEGAGTVEFIFDPSDESFFFMEMNTRLQVEHPVTEMVTGQDLVEWQLRVAGGEPLPLQQSDLAVNGHSVEARIYAENPYAEFLPGSGTLTYCKTPEASSTVRVETGVRQGDSVSVFYDPMIAKLVVWAPDRHQALRALYNNLGDYHIRGLATNIPFLREIVDHPAFKRDAQPELHTDFIPDYEDTLLARPVPTDTDLVLSTLALLWEEDAEASLRQLESSSDDIYSPWAVSNGARFNHRLTRGLEWNVDDTKYDVSITYTNNAGAYDITIGDTTFTATCSGDDNKLTAFVNGQKYDVDYVQEGRALTLFSSGQTFTFEIPAPKHEGTGVAASKGSLTAPMPGKVTKVFAEPGQEVAEGDAMIVVEAMKMEHTIRAPFPGTVESVNFGVGDMVTDKEPLVQIARPDEEE